MKKSVLAAALAGVMLLSGCSGVSQDEYNSLLEENSKLKESSSSESTSSETSSSSTSESSSSTESDISGESGNNEDSINSVTNKFVSKIEELEKFVDGFYISDPSPFEKYELVAPESEEPLGYQETYMGKFLRSEKYVSNVYMIFYSDDVKSNCSLIYNAMGMINKYREYSNPPELYLLYIDNSKNEHVATISNINGGFLDTPHITWYTSEAQEKYGEIENSSYFKDFKVKVLNQ